MDYFQVPFMPFFLFIFELKVSFFGFISPRDGVLLARISFDSRWGFSRSQGLYLSGFILTPRNCIKFIGASEIIGSVAFDIRYEGMWSSFTLLIFFSGDIPFFRLFSILVCFPCLLIIMFFCSRGVFLSFDSLISNKLFLPFAWDSLLRKLS